VTSDRYVNTVVTMKYKDKR